MLRVPVPCGQVGPFSEIVKAFEADNPGVKVHWTPENAVTIMNKIMDGKERSDLFLSMGDLEVDRVEREGLVLDGSRVQYAENSVAVMVPSHNPASVTRLEDLAKPAVRAITIPDPEQNSVGKHAVEALKNAGLWEKVRGKVLIARFAADSKEAAAQGHVDAGIGYYPCIVEVKEEGKEPTAPPTLKLGCLIPGSLYEPFYCEGAVPADAQHPEEARMLLEYMQRPASQEIFRKWQFVHEPAES